MLGFAACANNSGSNTKGDDKKPVDDQEFTADITTAVTWDGKDSSGNPLTYYINSQVDIKNGGHLTITEGAIVKFGPNGMFYVSVNGAITATGAKFTSYKDPDGRTISAAPDANPAMGDWKQITIKGGTGKFTSCKFYYGGKGECSTLAVSDSTGKARVDKCEFRYCDGTHAATPSDARAALRYTKDVTYNSETNCVTNSVFKNNKWPLAIPSFFTLDNSNTFGTTDEEKNEYNLVFINSNEIKITASWSKQNIPYLYAGSNYIAIKNGGILTIQGSSDANDPTMVCFATDGFQIQQGGQLNLSGNITFTNRPGSDTPFNGIFCRAVNNNGSSFYNYLTSSGTFIITNVKPNTSGHTAPISSTNTGA